MAALISELLIIFLLITSTVVYGASTTWCVVRSDASQEELQQALDYACGSGADCTPILSNGLCYLPNTIQAHASYAFNSYYQRKAMAPGSCDFSGTATIAQTDPSNNLFSYYLLSTFLLSLCFYVYIVLLIIVIFYFVPGYGSCVYPSSLRCVESLCLSVTFVFAFFFLFIIYYYYYLLSW